MTNEYKEKAYLIFLEICDEISAARNKYQRDFASLHEAYGVIKEEFDELWDEIKLKNPDPDKLHHEAMQTAAMLFRLMIENSTKLNIK